MLALETFEKAARVYASAVTRGIAFVHVSGLAAVGVSVLDYPELEAMAADEGLELSDFRDARKELSLGLTAHGAGAPSEVFARAMRSGGDGDVSDSVLHRKYELVGELFDAAPIRQQVWTKRTTKTPIFSRLDWEVVEKLSDDDLDRPEGERSPYALIQLKTIVRGTEETDFSEEILTFAADAADLKLVFSGLERLRRAMGEDGDAE